MASSSDHLHGDSTPPDASAEVEAIFNQPLSEDIEEEHNKKHCKLSDVSKNECTLEKSSKDLQAENSDIFKRVEVDRSFESTSEPQENETTPRPYRPTWCFDATLQQAGFYVDGYGIIPDPITTAEKIQKAKPIARSCALEAAEVRHDIRLRHVLRGGNPRKASPPNTEPSANVAKVSGIPKIEKTSDHYKIIGAAILSGVILVSVMAFIAGRYIIG